MTGKPPSPLDDIAAAAAGAQPAPDMRRPSGEADDGAEHDVAELGDDCPVQPLGALKKANYFLNYRGELIELGTKFEKGEVMQLFGTRIGWVDAKFPLWKKVGERTGADGQTVPIFEPDPDKGFNQALVQRALIMAGAKLPLFDPKNKVRGRGAHRGEDNELIVHCGDRVIVAGKRGTRRQPLRTQTFKPGYIGAFVYERADALPAPADAPGGVAVGLQLLDWLETWNWKRSEVDAYFVLCWIAVSFLGGALKVRPPLWITGPSGAGKTTLQQMIRLLLDGWAISTEDASAAGVRQLLDQDTLAVLFDEIEPDEGNGDVHQQIVKLARLAYSGGSGLRGTQDHKAKQFVAKSAFLFSSIHHHELPEQDRNRMAIVSLAKFPPKKEPLKTALPETIRKMGAEIRKRLIEEWHRFDDTLAAYQAAMLQAGFSGREQDTYGTLLACGDLVRYGSPPKSEASFLNDEAERVEAWVAKLGQVVDSVRTEAASTAERCLGHLTTKRLPGKPSDGQETIYRWVERAFIGICNAPDRKNAAKEKLGEHGMRLFHLKPGHDCEGSEAGLLEAYLPDSPIYLAIANKTHSGMKELFAGTDWTAGNWGQPLMQIEGAVGGKKTRISGRNHRVTLIPLAEVIDIEAVKKEAAALALQGELGT